MNIRKLLITIMLFAAAYCAGAQTTTQLEYWVNNRFSEKQTVALSGETEFKLNLPVGDLPVGFYQLHFRVKDSEDRYTAVSSGYFLKINNGLENGEMVCEYWFDDDMGQRETFPVWGVDNWIAVDLDAKALSLGIHSITFRIGCTGGFFSFSSKHFFVKGINPYAPEQLLNKYIYWFDDDLANAEHADITPAVRTFELNTDIPTTDLLPGRHTFNIKFKDNYEQFTKLSTDFFLKPHIFVEDFICEGSEYEFNGKPLTEAGEYLEIFEDVNGNDSIVHLTLTVEYPVTHEFSDSGCDTYTWDGRTYDTSGDKVWTYTAANGCDSTVTLHLTIHHNTAYGTDVVEMPCGATTFTWIDGVEYTSNNYTATHTITGGAANGCDSIVTLNLTFTSFAYGTDVVVMPCGATTFTWIDGVEYTLNNYTATYTITGGSVNGCDSTVTLNLTFRSIAYGTDVRNICGTTFTWINGVEYTSNNYTATHTIPGGAVNSCDSIVTLNLTFKPIAYGTDVRNICGTTFTWINGVEYTSNNYTATHTITGGAANGCDSIVTLNLTLRSIATGTDVVVMPCGATTFTWIDGVTYTSNNNTATWIIPGGAASGCDSIVTLNLTFKPFAHGTHVVVMPCGATTFTWIDGVVYTSNNNTATWIIPGGAANGCDSIVTLNLTFRPFALETHINVSNISACYGQTAKLTATSSIASSIFRWYTSQTATLPVHTGSAYTIGPLTSNTTYYVSVSGINVCENEPGKRKPVTVTVEICEIMNCSLLKDRVVNEDAPKSGFYTHSGTDWDAEIANLIAQPFDNVKYYINGTLTTTGATLNGAQFPVGSSQVMVVAYFGTNSTTCYFTVSVKSGCPLVSDPDGDGNTYPVTKLAGLCWTSNLKTTKYADGTDIPFAKPYEHPLNPNVALNTENFGLLYTWDSALGVGIMPAASQQGVCPSGWRIPTAAELKLLLAFESIELKNPDFWLKPNSNNNATEFDARGAGLFNSATNRFEDLYGYAGYWSSNANEATATCAELRYNCSVLEIHNMLKTKGLSVRCVVE